MYQKWLEEGGDERQYRLWTNGHEPIEGTNKWFWDDQHTYGMAYLDSDCLTKVL